MSEDMKRQMIWILKVTLFHQIDPKIGNRNTHINYTLSRLMFEYI